MLRNWQRGLRINHIAHHRAAARDAALGLALGVTVIVLSTIVGTAIFTTLDQSPSTAAKTAVGLLSAAAAVFGALQTFLGFPQRQAAHHEAAVRYGALRREIESVLGLPPGEQELRQLLLGLRLRWDEIDAGAPAVSQRIWRSAVGTVEQAEAAT
ncbi:MAG TPA: SLATT domain-containing protein, partial [Solirubrobacterales bacterium]|nr:SLATT domain-containing protein [Solirubrobacterales bacterium]